MARKKKKPVETDLFVGNDNPPVCAICQRPEGSFADVSGVVPYVNPYDTSEAAQLALSPLGALEQCDLCALLVCPDCLHEADCCFRAVDDHRDEPDWAPPGWRRIDANNWERLCCRAGLSTKVWQQAVRFGNNQFEKRR